MPVVATSMTGQLALASNDETTLTALGKSLGSRDVQVEFEHDRLLIVNAGSLGEAFRDARPDASRLARASARECPLTFSTTRAMPRPCPSPRTAAIPRGRP